MVEQEAVNFKVAGSNPAGAAIFLCSHQIDCRHYMYCFVAEYPVFAQFARGSV